MKHPSRQAGFSLIEILIAVGLLGVFAAGMASLLTNMARENRALTEKLSSLEVARSVTAALAVNSFCTAALTLPTAFTFNATALPASGTVPSGKIPLGPSANAVQVGAVAGSSRLVVSALDIVNIQNAGAPERWTGSIQISFDNTLLVRAIKPLQMQIIFNTDPTSPATAKRTVSCGLLTGKPVVTISTITNSWGQRPVIDSTDGLQHGHDFCSLFFVGRGDCSDDCGYEMRKGLNDPANDRPYWYLVSDSGSIMQAVCLDF